MATLLCPYCFNPFASADIVFRCMNPNVAKCGLEPDEALANYQGMISTGPLMKKIFAPPKKFLGGVIGPMVMRAKCACGYESSKRLCPSCHNDLPSEFGVINTYTIALIGAKYTGKTNYIGVLIRRLKNDVGRNFGAALTALDDQTTNRYRDEYEKPLFREGQAITVSASVQTAASTLRYPLNYRLSQERQGPLKGVRATSFSLFDTAGEDLDAEEMIQVHNRYIANADAILCMLDPLQFPVVQQRIGSSMALPPEASDPTDIIERVERVIREARRIPPTRKVNIPLAVAFSKIDAVRSLVEPNSPIHRATSHNGYYDEIDGQQLHESMRAYLTEWGKEDLDNTLRVNFERYRYFGLSALGSAPEANLKLSGGVVPYRVEDPILWLLSELKFISARKGGA